MSSGKKYCLEKKKKKILFPIQNFYFLNISLYLVKERITFFCSFVRCYLVNPLLTCILLLSEKGCCLHRIAFGLVEENLYTLFVCFFPFILNACKNKHTNCNRKCLLYSKTYSGFVLIALIWKRRKSRIKCLQRQFWGFVLSGTNELNLHFHCYCFVVVTWVYKLLWKYFAASEFICMWFHVWFWLSLIWYMMIHSLRLSWHRIRKTKFNYLWKHTKFIFQTLSIQSLSFDIKKHFTIQHIHNGNSVIFYIFF